VTHKEGRFRVKADVNGCNKKPASASHTFICGLSKMKMKRNEIYINSNVQQWLAQELGVRVGAEVREK
jgi:hypothetical protein